MQLQLKVECTIIAKYFHKIRLDLKMESAMIFFSKLNIFSLSNVLVCNIGRQFEMSMYVDNITGEFCFHKNLALTPFLTKKEIMESNCLNWEPWPDKGDKTVSYRTIFDIKGNKQG
ncbi:Uncharacterised protein [Enterobacter cloacae]|uniref:Uncharacterized protein n=1 Tax=Enterobacter cloacae TaxID=550 RepID=A0A377M160_ENTCL|nr:Uncharacterised protein [Enterobacter cloacae]